MITKTHMITKTQWLNFLAMKEAYLLLKDEIVDHMDTIIRAVFKYHKLKIDWWALAGNCEANLIGEIMVDDDYLNVEVVLTKPSWEGVPYQTMSGDEYDLLCQFPIDFLFLSKQEVLVLIDNAYKAQQKEIKLIEEELNSNSLAKEKLKKAALKKLSKKEIKALGL